MTYPSDESNHQQFQGASSLVRELSLLFHNRPLHRCLPLPICPARHGNATSCAGYRLDQVLRTKRKALPTAVHHPWQRELQQACWRRWAAVPFERSSFGSADRWSRFASSETGQCRHFSRHAAVAAEARMRINQKQVVGSAGRSVCQLE